MTIPLDAIRQALDGAIPATIATCAPDGVPNVSFVSQVYYVDPEHTALSYQFFNKTRQNVLATRRAAVLVIDPQSFARYRLALEYVRVETSGPLFERMKAHLAGIASHTGMAGVFKLQGADVYRVLAIERVPGYSLPGAAPQRHHLAAVRAIAERIAGCADLSNLLDEALAALDDALGIRHAMILMADPRAGKLYTVASRGYDASGVGSEIAFGEGVIGVAARERTLIRIMHRAYEWPALLGGSQPPIQGPPTVIRHYMADDSIFVGDDYLIKGVAGAIFWKLLRDYTGGGRTDFTNRELRLDASIRLPDLSDNLEARLILLSRRLAERTRYLAIEKTGRGRFRLCVRQPVELEDISNPASR